MNFTTPVARLVQGNVSVPETTDHENRPLVIKNGPNAGQPTQNYFFAIAVPKADPGLPALYEMVQAAGREGFPTLFDAAGACIHPAFSWKFEDGDSQVPNSNGKRPCDRDGFPGNIIFKFSGKYAPKIYSKTAEGAFLEIDGSQIKRGYFVQVQGSVKGNGNAQKPGVYLNHNMILFAGVGEEMTSGPSAADAFAGSAASPVAPAAVAAPGVQPVAAALPVAAAPVAAPVSGVAAPVAAAPVAAAPVAAAPVAAAALPGVIPAPATTMAPPVAAALPVAAAAPAPGVAPLPY